MKRGGGGGGGRCFPDKVGRIFLSSSKTEPLALAAAAACRILHVSKFIARAALVSRRLCLGSKFDAGKLCIMEEEEEDNSAEREREDWM